MAVYKADINQTWDSIKNDIKSQMTSRGYRAANELRNASQLVLRGRRSGRRYIVPGTGRVKYNKKTKNSKITYVYYTASAPGEPPANRLGHFRESWHRKSFVESKGSDFTVVSQVESTIRTEKGKYLLGEILENGTGNMAPRPHQEKIQQKALQKIIRIYNEPYRL